jgi:hypothetical protein
MTKQLTELHSLLAEKLLEKVKDPECKSADLNVARQFLKDNNIDAVPVEGSPLDNLIEELPFNNETRKVTVKTN